MTLGHRHIFLMFFGVSLWVGAAKGANLNQYWLNHACSREYSKYCADIPGGEGRVNRCLHAHEIALSPQCSANLGIIDDSDPEPETATPEPTQNHFPNPYELLRKKMDEYYNPAPPPSN